jgi:rhodanese-related sulfurtransferase
MPIKDFKTCMFEQLARAGKAFSNPNRIELLELLSQGEKTVDVLAGLAGLSVANTSQHLQLLRNSGLVESVKKGQFVHYSIASSSVIDILLKLRELAGSQLEMLENALAKREPDKNQHEVVMAEDLDKIADSVLVVDVRPEDEYASGHIKGAINIPLAELDDKISSIKTDKPVVAYCRGPYCLLSREAVSKLQTQGIDAKRLNVGFTQWKNTGGDFEFLE